MTKINPFLVLSFALVTGCCGSEPDVNDLTPYESCLSQENLPLGENGHVESGEVYVLEMSDETGSQGETVYVPVTNIVMQRGNMFNRHALSLREQTDLDRRVLETVNRCYAFARQPS